MIRFGRRLARVRVCDCCFARLGADEQALFATETQKNLVVRAVLGVLAGELALEREDEADAARKGAALASPFLETLDPDTRDAMKRLISE